MHPIIYQYRDQITALCERYDVDVLYAFGSVTEAERFTGESDLDFLVDLRLVDKDYGRYTDNFFDLNFALEALTGRTVDLLTVRSLRNPYLIEELERTRVEIFRAKALAA